MGSESITIGLFSLLGKLAIVALPAVIVGYLWLIAKRRSRTRSERDARARLFMTQLMTERAGAKDQAQTEPPAAEQLPIAPVSTPPKAMSLAEADRTSTAFAEEREIDLVALASQMSRGRDKEETSRLMVIFIMAVSVIALIISTSYYFTINGPADQKPVSYSIFVKVVTMQAVAKVEITGGDIHYFMKNGDSNSTQAPLEVVLPLLDQYKIPYKFIEEEQEGKFSDFQMLLILLVALLLPSNIFLQVSNSRLKKQLRERR